jgi:hypothetical protein
VQFASSAHGAVALDWRHFKRRRSPDFARGKVRFAQFIAVTWLMRLCAVAPGEAEKRVALVVGNAAYRHADKLANPVNDARGMRDALKKLPSKARPAGSRMGLALFSSLISVVLISVVLISAVP